MEDRRPPVWLALDEVTDPQNLGGILRSAYFLGVDGVALCARNSAPLSPTVSKASAGALEVMELHEVNSLPRFLTMCQEAGWDVYGADAGPESVDVREVAVRGPCILVMGSEGFGLRPLVRQNCTALVRVAGVEERPEVRRMRWGRVPAAVDRDSGAAECRWASESGAAGGRWVRELSAARNRYGTQLMARARSRGHLPWILST